MKEKRTAMTSCCFCVEYLPFYWKNLNSISATAVLSRLPVGSFLLRPSSQNPAYQYTISQKITDRRNGVKHIRIKRDNSGGYLLDTDESAVNSTIIRFACVTNLIKSWGKVYGEIGNKCVLTPVLNRRAYESSDYVNEENRSVCFYEDKEADKSFRNFFTEFRRQRS